MNNKFSKILQDFINEDDDIYLGQIIYDVSRVINFDEKKLSLNDANELWQAIKKFIGYMLDNGFIAVNHVKGNTYRYEAWPEQNVEAIAQKIKTDWIAVKGDPVNVAFIVWFHPTEIAKARRSSEHS